MPKEAHLFTIISSDGTLILVKTDTADFRAAVDFQYGRKVALTNCHASEKKASNITLFTKKAYLFRKFC